MLGVIPLAASRHGLGLDWLAHFLEFLVLMAWFGGIVSTKRHIYVAVALIALGVFIEILQAANIFRSFDLKDIVWNIAGVIAGWVLVRTWLRDWCQRIETVVSGFRS